jgi:tRNA uridine 5-carboxymethylaminomethyl modification enzyme
MFTSRAEHRILLRPDNAGDRLTERAREVGLLEDDAALGLGPMRVRAQRERNEHLAAIGAIIDSTSVDGVALSQVCRRTDFDELALARIVRERQPGLHVSPRVWLTAYADRKYEPYVVRQRAEVRRHAEMERRRVPQEWKEGVLAAMRPEARQALLRFRPGTFGQAARLEGMTPADMTLLAVLVRRQGASV